MESMDCVRVMVDGVFDCTHFGHANSLLQARQFGNVVIAVIHPDREVLKHKHCLPVYPEHERYALMKAQRYADLTIEDVRYDFDLTDLESMKINCVAHGDEPVFNASGTVLYKDIQDAGKYRYFKRTRGTCTTDIIQAVLDLGQSNNHSQLVHIPTAPVFLRSFQKLLAANYEITKSQQATVEVKIHKDGYFAFDGSTTQGDVVLVIGNFEMFNYGHLRFLQAAIKSVGNDGKLVVGITSDNDVRMAKGPGRPLVNAVQRAANVLSYRCVDGVILMPDDHCDHLLEIVEQYRICKVVIGRTNGTKMDEISSTNCFRIGGSGDLGFEAEIMDSGSDVRTTTIIQRIIARESTFLSRNIIKNGLKSNNDGVILG